MKWKNYWAPTPKKWRKIGDALLGISTLSVPAMMADYKPLAIGLFAVGVIGKFLTNFFTDEESTPTPPTP